MIHALTLQGLSNMALLSIPREMPEQAIQSPPSHLIGLLVDPFSRLLLLASTNVASLPMPGGKAYEGDGGPASEAGLDLPNAIAFSPTEAGSVMAIADFGHSAVRAVTPARPCF